MLPTEVSFLLKAFALLVICGEQVLVQGTSQSNTEHLPFYSLVELNIPGLLELPRTEDSHSDPIFILEGLIFGDEIVTHVYVNENGAFSFMDPWMYSHPNPYPTTYLPTRQGHVVSPFWSDIDIRKEGTVRYVTITRGSSTYGDAIMDQAAAYVNNGFIGGPTWVLVAQWEGVHPHPHGADDREGIDDDYLDQTNTFQGVIITDGIQSYFVFTYICGKMEWSGQGLETATVGYNSNGDYYDNNPANGLPDIAQIISCVIPEGGRRKRQMQTDRNVSTTGSLTPDSMNLDRKRIYSCRNISMNDMICFSNITIIQQSLENTLLKCPSTEENLLNFSAGFQKFPQQQGNCYRTRQMEMIVADTFKGSIPFVYVCCYRDGLIIRTGLGAGRITSLLNDDTSRNIDIHHFKNDCCNNSMTQIYCPRYTDRRPYSEVADNETSSSSGHGDPHYSTFENKNYTFVAEGEYIAFGLNNAQGDAIFQMQVRLGTRGYHGSSTVAIAFGVPGEYAYQFVHNDEEILLQTIPTPVQEVTGDVDNEYVDITHSGNMLTAIIKNLHIRIVASWHIDRKIYRYVNYHVFVPHYLCEESFGHLGNCDGNPDNDVPGQDEYRVTESQTLFTYGNISRKKRQIMDSLQFECTSFDNCGNHSFVGVHFEDLTFTEEQMVMCNNDEMCLYDLVVTGDEEFAAQTLRSRKEVGRMREIIRNKPPIITGDNVFRVNVGEENIYLFTVIDTVSFNVAVEGGDGGILSDNGDGEYSFTWTPEVISFISGLSFVAMDSAGAATLHRPSVHMCACFNGGECTEEGVHNLYDSVIILTCFCPDAYSGDTCSEDRNGCAEIECFSGVECFDVPAPGVGAVCGPCSTGFTGDGVKCSDINECAETSSLCDQICENTFGSYICTCEPGYNLNDQMICEDIDECSGADDCQQDCTNTQGSFECTCVEGFTLDDNNKTCTPQTTCNTNSCSHICAIVDGRNQCFCPVGFELSMTTTTCEDIDECERFSPCDQVCTNSEGSFECSCNDGFRLQNNSHTCEDIDECRVAALASLVLCTGEDTWCVNTYGSFQCVCVPGFRLIDGHCQRIIGEVIELPEVVIPEIGQDNAVVYNVLTYEINELTAERLQEFRVATASAITRYCARVECLLVTLNGNMSFANVTARPQDIAIPTVNSASETSRHMLTFYAQLPNSNFVSSNNVLNAVEEAEDLYQRAGFADVDECATNNGGCAEICTNTNRAFECSCGTGYTLAADNMNCVDMDECSEDTAGCSQTCTNTDGSFECSCGTGYTLSADNFGCNVVLLAKQNTVTVTLSDLTLQEFDTSQQLAFRTETANAINTHCDINPDKCLQVNLLPRVRISRQVSSVQASDVVLVDIIASGMNGVEFSMFVLTSDSSAVLDQQALLQAVQDNREGYRSVGFDASFRVFEKPASIPMLIIAIVVIAAVVVLTVIVINTFTIYCSYRKSRRKKPPVRNPEGENNN